jgi:hypothetical protein
MSVMARLLWHEHDHPTVNLALVIGAAWLALAVVAAVYDIGRWFNAW